MIDENKRKEFCPFINMYRDCKDCSFYWNDECLLIVANVGNWSEDKK